jgi:cytochrome c-type biogenesis protein CcmH/NrfG
MNTIINHYQATKEKSYLSLIILCIFVVLFAFSLFNISFFLSKTHKSLLRDSNNSQQVIKTPDIKLDQQINYWETFLEENPTYQYGYIILGKLYFQGGRLSEAYKALDYAKNLNPNSEFLIKTLEELASY